MNTSAVVLFSVVLSAAAATGVSFALRPGEPPPDTAVPDMQRAIADLRIENAALQKKLDELRKAPSPVSVPASVDRAEAATVSPEQVAAAVEAYLRLLPTTGPAAAASRRSTWTRTSPTWSATATGRTARRGRRRTTPA
jgi:hypothetical protein